MADGVLFLFLIPPVIKIKEMGNGVTNYTPRSNGERVPAKYLIKAGDLLFSWSATLMVIIWSGEDGWLNQHLFKVGIKDERKSEKRLFLLPFLIRYMLSASPRMHLRQPISD